MDRLSLPKDKIRVLLLEGVNDSAVDLFAGAGYANVTRLPKALDGEALPEALQGVHMLGIRSRTQLTDEVLAAADRLIAVGCFSVGTNQVDLDAARAARHPGVQRAVLQHPQRRRAGDRRDRHAAAPHLPALGCGACRAAGTSRPRAASRCAARRSASSATAISASQLSTLAEAMGMRVIYFDHTDKLRHGNTEPADSLRRAAGAKRHRQPACPGDAGDPRHDRRGRDRGDEAGRYLINNSRGTVVDLDALAGALRDGHLRGAAVDVFPVEPASNAEPFGSPLQGLPNVILTPHVGGSTQEAQERIGAEVARKLIDYSDIGSTVGAVNFPQVQLPARPPAPATSMCTATCPACWARIDEVFARRGLNIAAQYLQTYRAIGYVVVETDGGGRARGAAGRVARAGGHAAGAAPVSAGVAEHFDKGVSQYKLAACRDQPRSTAPSAAAGCKTRAGKGDDVHNQTWKTFMTAMMIRRACRKYADRGWPGTLASV